MDKKTAGIVATVLTVIFCGCPGLMGMCWGAIAAAVSFIPGAEIDMGGSSDPQIAFMVGIVSLCLGVIFVAIPVVVGFLTLRNKPAATAPVFPDEPLPPAI